MHETYKTVVFYILTDIHIAECSKSKRRLFENELFVKKLHFIFLIHCVLTNVTGIWPHV